MRVGFPRRRRAARASDSSPASRTSPTEARRHQDADQHHHLAPPSGSSLSDVGRWPPPQISIAPARAPVGAPLSSCAPSNAFDRNCSRGAHRRHVPLWARFCRILSTRFRLAEAPQRDGIKLAIGVGLSDCISRTLTVDAFQRCCLRGPARAGLVATLQSAMSPLCVTLATNFDCASSRASVLEVSTARFSQRAFPVLPHWPPPFSAYSPSKAAVIALTGKKLSLGRPRLNRATARCFAAAVESERLFLLRRRDVADGDRQCPE